MPPWAGVLNHGGTGAGQEQGDPPVPERGIDDATTAGEGHGSGIKDQPAAWRAAFHQRVAERGRCLPPPAHRARRVPLPQEHPVGAVDLPGGGGAVCDGGQSAGEVMRQPEIVLIGKRHRTGGQVGMTEQAEIIRRHALLRAAQDHNRVGTVLSKGADQRQRGVGGAIIADLERPVGMVLCGKAGQLLAQERAAVAGAHEHGDMGQGGHAGIMAWGRAKYNHK